MPIGTLWDASRCARLYFFNISWISRISRSFPSAVILKSICFFTCLTKLLRLSSVAISGLLRQLCPQDIRQRENRAALAFVIGEQLRQLPFIIACDAVRQHMDGIAVFSHIEAGGFDARCGVGSGKITIGNPMLLQEGSKRLTGQGVAFCLRKDMVGHDVQLRHQLCAAGSGFKGPRSSGQVVVLDINDPQVLPDRLVDCLVDVFDDFSVVFRDVILQVDDDQRTVFHNGFFHCFS